MFTTNIKSATINTPRTNPNPMPNTRSVPLKPDRFKIKLNAVLNNPPAMMVTMTVPAKATTARAEESLI